MTSEQLAKVTDEDVEECAIAMLNARGHEMKTLPRGAVWLAYNKDQIFKEVRAALTHFVKRREINDG